MCHLSMKLSDKFDPNQIRGQISETKKNDYNPEILGGVGF